MVPAEEAVPARLLGRRGELAERSRVEVAEGGHADGGAEVGHRGSIGRTLACPGAASARRQAAWVSEAAYKAVLQRGQWLPRVTSRSSPQGQTEAPRVAVPAVGRVVAQVGRVVFIVVTASASLWLFRTSTQRLPAAVRDGARRTAAGAGPQTVGGCCWWGQPPTWCGWPPTGHDGGQFAGLARGAGGGGTASVANCPPWWPQRSGFMIGQAGQNETPCVRAPELWAAAGSTPTARTALRDLRGRFVLLGLLTFCCVNALHVLDELRPVEERYADELVVIVHSLERLSTRPTRSRSRRRSSATPCTTRCSTTPSWSHGRPTLPGPGRRWC